MKTLEQPANILEPHSKAITLPELVAKVEAASEYPSDWQLQDKELASIFELCNEALRTTNGDSGSVQLTARQTLLLLRSHLGISSNWLRTKQTKTYGTTCHY